MLSKKWKEFTLKLLKNSIQNLKNIV